MAEAPQAELFDYAIVLRSMTQARGNFSMHFERYEEVPAQVAAEDYCSSSGRAGEIEALK